MAESTDKVVVEIKLKDVARFIADVKSGKLAIDDLEKKIQKAGRTAAAESGSSGGFGKLASHFGTLATWATRGAGALAVAGAGVAAYAVKSAASFEQVQVSLETMLGSTSKAKSMMGDLQKFAVRTPFEFSDVSKQAQHLLAFGFAAKSIIPTLTAVGNASSGLSLGPEGLDRIDTALGQIRTKGRVQGDEMLQLAEAGINANAYLEKAFHMTPAQLQKAQQAGKISAAAAIPVILKGMDDQFHGLMTKQSGTLTGIWSNFHDAMQQGLKDAVDPFLPAMKTWLKRAVDAIPGLMRNLQSGIARGGQLLTLAWSKAMEIKDSAQFHSILDMFTSFGRVIRDVAWPAVRDFGSAVGVGLAGAFLAATPLLTKAFDFIDQHRDMFKAITVGLLAFVTAYKVYNAVLKVTAVWQAIVEATNPITLILAAVTALGVGLYYAYNHSATFRRFVNGLWSDIKAVWGWVRDHWKLLAPMLLGPFGLVIGWVATHFPQITQAIDMVRVWIQRNWSKIASWLTAPFKVAQAVINGIADHIVITWNTTVGSLGGPKLTASDGTKPGGGFLSTAETLFGLINPAAGLGASIGSHVADAIPGHAAGGVVTRTHSAWVGERGPELLTLPRGSSVIPLPRVPQFASRGPVHVHVDLNGKEIAHAVYEDISDRIARR